MKKYYKLIFLYGLIVAFNMLWIPNNLDEIWNYGFSYALRLGEIPYKDFNMVITPLFSFIMTIPLLIVNNYLSYVLFYSIFITIEYYLLFQIMEKKSWILLLISFLFFPIIYPTYNSFFLFLMVLIIYLEKKDFANKDYIIGFLIACCILTKQSAGIFFVIPTLLFYKRNKMSIRKRVIGFSVPIILFCMYLIVTHSFKAFLNLCVFGLFDFSGNFQGFNGSMIIFILIIGISIYFLKKNKEDIEGYYLVLSYLLYVPLFDFLHLYYVLFSFAFLIFIDTKEYKIKYELFFAGCLLAVLLIMGRASDVIHYKKNKLSHFEYKNIAEQNVRYTQKIIKYMKENDVIIYHDDSYFYRIVSNQKIGYLDLLNHGNHGYRGNKELIRLIKENSDKQFLVHQDCEERIKEGKTQLDEDGYYYIVENATKIGAIEDYNIYSFQE